jgi:hypothetical protein
MLARNTILAVDDDDRPLTEAELSLSRLLGGQPSHFIGKTPYHQVVTIVRLLVDKGWLPSPTVWKNPGPIKQRIEYPLRDGWRMNITFPADVGNNRDRELARVQFLPPGEPSPPKTHSVAHFHFSPALNAVYIHKGARG